MRSLLRSIRRFLSELKRRNVYRVALAYLAAGFVVVELANIAAGAFDLPGWFEPMVWTVCGLGFPIALVMAWALEMTPEGVRVDESVAEETEGTEEIPSPASTTRDLWVGASVLALLLLGAWWMWGSLGIGEPANEAESKAPKIDDRSIAVLPFEVSGAGAEEWRDGMVTALSLNLDGAAGLRTIADRTVFAAWEKRSSTGEGASTEEALEVARSVGAEYAIVGSALKLGEELRLGVEVRRAATAERLGQVEVQGSPERITSLTDRLTQEVLGILLEKSEEALPSVDLASITTESLAALKSFLAGEAHLRAGEYEAAIEEYQAATEQDSTFALAYARLATSRSWVQEDTGHPALRQAYQLSGRLPDRERRLIQARHLRVAQNRAVEAADSLRELAKEYPGDPNVWYWLGETLFHEWVPRGWPEADEAFAEANRLDPGVVPYQRHLSSLAFSVHHDSALAAKRIEAYPDGLDKRWYRVLWDLNFGSPDRRKEAWAQIDTFSVGSVGSVFLQAWFPLSHPTDRELQGRVLETLSRREEVGPGIRNLQWLNVMLRGKVATALPKAPEGPGFSCFLIHNRTIGYPIPDSTLRSRLDPSNVEAEAPTRLLRCAGLYLAERGRARKLRSMLERIRGRAQVQSRSPGARNQASQAVRSVRGYRAYRAGSLRVAQERWSGFNAADAEGAIWRGDLYRRLGELNKAEGWCQAAWRHPVAHERLGQLYEEMGKPDEAAAAYERFVAAWKDADPELQDRVEKARERLEALGRKETAE